MKRLYPCDTDNICPYETMGGGCAYWCHVGEEISDDPAIWEEDDDG